MLIDRKAAARYARALLRLAEQAGNVEQVQADLDLVAAILEQEPQIARALDHPLLTPAQKKDLLRRALEDHLQPVTLDYLEMLIDKRRTKLLPAIRDVFRSTYEDHLGVVPAQVASAVPLSATELASVRRSLQRLFGAQPIITTEIDPEIIGGVRARVRNTVIDGTIRGALGKMRDYLERQAEPVLRRGTVADEQ